MINANNIDFEDLIAYSIEYMSAQTRLEIEMKEWLIKHFEVDLKFGENYNDFNIVFPNHFIDKNPQLLAITDYKWCNSSNNIEEIFVFKSCAMEMGETKPFVPVQTQKNCNMNIFNLVAMA